MVPVAVSGAAVCAMDVAARYAVAGPLEVSKSLFSSIRGGRILRMIDFPAALGAILNIKDCLTATFERSSFLSRSIDIVS